jgi:hypothetical protein
VPEDCFTKSLLSTSLLMEVILLRDWSGGRFMRKLNKVWFPYLLAALICFFSLPAKADPIYQVTGTGLFTGNNVCSGSPCTETINFSLDLFWVFTNGSGYSLHFSDFSATGSGALGSFNDSIVAGTFACCSYFLQITDPEGDRIDFNAGPGSNLAPAMPMLTGITIDACQTMSCVTDFYPLNLQSGPPYAFGDVVVANLTDTESLVPEPPEALLMSLGLTTVGLLGLWARTRDQRGRIFIAS